MAFKRENCPEGLWEVTDVEGDTICICQKLTAVWLQIVLNKFWDISTPMDLEKLKAIADAMEADDHGMGGYWGDLFPDGEYPL